MVVCVKLLHVNRDVLVKAFDAVIELARRKIIVLGICSLELAAVNGDVRLGEQLQSHAELVELLIYFSNSLLVILAEIGDCTKIASQLTEQPHHLNVALAFACKLARRANLIKVTVDVELEQIARVLARSAGLCWSAADKSQFIHFETVNECIEQTNGGICLHIFVNAVWEEYPLVPGCSCYVCHVIITF